jgi:hypothetical protein
MVQKLVFVYVFYFNTVESHISNIIWLGFILIDGVCDYGPTVGSNTAECEFDGGDCTEFNLKYPECDTYEPQKIGGEFTSILLYEQ